MAVNWATLRNVLLFIGPLLLPKAIGYWRSVKRPSAGPAPPIRPTPAPVSRALAILFAAAALLFIHTLPILSPENVFVATQSRLQAPADVLFRRLAAVRPGGVLGPRDEVLRARFAAGIEPRLLYLQFGPDVLTDCLFCADGQEPSSWLYYAVPALLMPHVLNLLLLATVTSLLVSGRDGARWRTGVTMVAAAACMLDLYAVNSYNGAANAQATRLADLDFFFWTARVYRLTALAAIDALLGWVMYLSSTNRAFVRPATAAERVDAAVRALSAARARLGAVAVVRNTALRDEGLRGRGLGYWAHEVRLMDEVMEERDVIASVKDALENRVNIEAISRDAEEYARVMLATDSGG